jgi:thioester reductase-like protein
MTGRGAGATTILFTGFPGFIGLRLLPRLLELQPEARVACLVQEKF